MKKNCLILSLIIGFGLNASAQIDDTNKPLRDTIYKYDTVVVLRYIRDTVYTTNPELVKPKPQPRTNKTIIGINNYKVNDKVMVVWNSDWYPATIIEVKDQQYKITYDGFNASWDEWITDDRIKKRE